MPEFDDLAADAPPRPPRRGGGRRRRRGRARAAAAAGRRRRGARGACRDPRTSAAARRARPAGARARRPPPRSWRRRAAATPRALDAGGGRDRGASSRSHRPAQGRSRGSTTASRSCCCPCGSRRASRTSTASRSSGCASIPTTARSTRFEETLSETEVDNARAVLDRRSGEAGGIEDQERGAWRGLVASHGSGRAQWIVQQYRPAEPDDAAARTLPSDVVLTIATDAPRRRPRPAAAAFWDAVWLRRRPTATRPPRRPRCRRRRTRADAIAGATAAQPRHTADAAAQAPTRSVAFLACPDRRRRKPRLVDARAAGGDAARPLRAARLQRRRTAARRARRAGADAADRRPRPVGAARPSSSSRRTASIVIPEPMRWMVDFDAAVEAGMGFRVAARRRRRRHGFDRCWCSACALSDDEDSAREASRPCSSTTGSAARGFALLPQGTPTNNTEAAPAGYTRGDDPDVSFDDLADAPLFTDDPDWRDQARRPVARRAARHRPGRCSQTAHDAGTGPGERARDEHRAVAGDDRLLDGDADAPGARPTTSPRSRAGSSPATSAAAARSRRSGSAASRTASCRRQRSRACAGSSAARRRGGDDGSSRRLLRRCCAAIDADWAGMSAAGVLRRQARATRTGRCSTSSACTRGRSSSQRYAESVHAALQPAQPAGRRLA